ncbi:transmembrane protein, putative (macronuclear) [Tetrahymena thermophila SB210]|uniref:Transmembrane protein, putative n=1 Tax=Tetrahymena thermophila (strain SB210) TaxID=312017 RepID=Q22KE2_TETTS|nr:transmembrane protein, putative [Tetrahymena thermophila SB210]EAR85857.2 transmembrane protein, putative [Tetrahymena thermophila SB210]|eukprot:XP_001033520.2 transmembrane protein, putative [Tetrahymena thermophila SB210]
MNQVQGRLLTVVQNEQYNKFTQSINLSNPQNYWVKKPIPFSDSVQLSVQCVKNRDWNPEFLILQKDETLIKYLNTHYYSNSTNHFQMIINAKILLIDVTQKDFTLQVKSGDIIKKISNLIGSDSQYCYEYHQFKTDCNDYCASSAYDSYVNLTVGFEMHTDPLIKLEFSSENLQEGQFIGIHSLSIQVDLCDENCLKCSGSPDKCSICKESSHYLDISTHKCVQNCSLGQFEDTDQANPSQKVCRPCIFQNCLKCESTQCTQCQQGYHFDFQENKCVFCQQSCDICADTSTCSQCIKGFYLNQGICQKCQSGCLDCKSENFCNACSQNYYLNNNQCQKCLPFCQDCQDGQTCKQCLPGYLFKKRIDSILSDECVIECGQSFFPSNDNKTCIYQDDSQCEESIDKINGCQNKKCRILGSNIFANYKKECILNCPQGYFKNKISEDRYSCVQCPQNCSSCVSMNECTECADQYFLQKNFQNTLCQKCPEQCNSCTQENQCTSCKDGYFLDNNQCLKVCSGSKYGKDNKCFDCNLVHCSKCFSSDVCEICETDFVEIDGQCLQKCHNGEYREGNNPYCSKCLKNCIDCTSGTQCNSCKSGFYLANNFCKPCDSSCETCSGPLPYQCQTCDEKKNLFLFQNSCISQCPDGYYQSGNKLCQSCSSKGCAKCSQINQCSLCKSSSDFLKNDKECTQICPIDHQIFIDENNILNCYKIECEYGKQQNQKKCEEICGDGIVQNQECDDGNLQNGDGCNDKCQIEPQFECSQTNINLPSICKFALEYHLLDQGIENSFVIQFNTSVDLLKEDIFDLQIESLNKDDFSYSIGTSLSKQNQVVVNLNFKVLVPPQIQLIVKNQFVEDSYIRLIEFNENIEFVLREQQNAIIIKSQYNHTKDETRASKVIEILAKIFCTLIMISFIPLVFLGNSNLLVSIVDALQIIQFHSFIDIKYPLVLQEFLKVFSVFDFKIFKNIFSVLIPNSLDRYSYDSFERNNRKSIYLLNTGQYYTLFALIIFLHCVFKLIGKKYSQVKKSADRIFQYKIYYEFLALAYFHIVFYTFLQWTNMQTELQIEYFNQILMFLTFIIVFPTPIMGIIFINKYYTKLTESSVQEKFGSVWQGLKEDLQSKIYFAYVGVKKIIYCLIFIFMNKITIIQCAFLIIPPTIFIAFIIMKKPFLNKAENFKQIFQETIFILAAILLIILKASDGQKEQIRNIYSSLVIVLFFGLLICHSHFVMVEINNQFLKKIIKLITLKVKEAFKKSQDRYLVKQQNQNKNHKKTKKRKQQNKKILSKDFLTKRTEDIQDDFNMLQNIPRSYNFDQIDDKEFLNNQKNKNIQVLNSVNYAQKNSENSLNGILQGRSLNEINQSNYKESQQQFVYESSQLITFMDVSQQESQTKKAFNNNQQQQMDITIEKALNENCTYQTNTKFKRPKINILKQQLINDQLSSFADLNQISLEVESPITNQFKLESQTHLDFSSYSSTSIGSPDKLIKQSSSQILLCQGQINQQQSINDSPHNLNDNQNDNDNQKSVNGNDQNFINSLNKFRNKRKHNSLIRRSLRPAYGANFLKSLSLKNLEQSESNKSSQSNLDQNMKEQF